MENHYKCLTCYLDLTKDEYEEHKRNGHITVEYVLYEDLKKEQDTNESN